MPAKRRILRLFEGYGIELEYMIVDEATLDVCPLADRVLRDDRGHLANEIGRGAFAWSNELACHVIEIKTNGPAADLGGLARSFSDQIAQIETLLAPHGARLLPTAMHPWMDPVREFQIWPHGDRAIYEAFDRIFDCRGHGWANLQSAHLNLPFSNDTEFGDLHAAARALLPLLPALAAASPFREGHYTGSLDTRLDVYRTNASRIPSVTGLVIPEPVYARRDYERLLETIYADLAPLDRAGTLRHEWVNARGCIARFDRMALEIRLLDVQECPLADLAIAAAVARVLRALCDVRPGGSHQCRLRGLETTRLAHWLAATIADGDAAQIDDPGYLTALGLEGTPRSAREVWSTLVARHVAPDPAAAEYLPVIEVLLERGPLARRILQRTGQRPTLGVLRSTYRELAECLRAGKLFGVAA